MVGGKQALNYEQMKARAKTIDEKWLSVLQIKARESSDLRLDWFYPATGFTFSSPDLNGKYEARLEAKIWTTKKNEGTFYITLELKDTLDSTFAEYGCILSSLSTLNRPAENFSYDIPRDFLPIVQRFFEESQANGFSLATLHGFIMSGFSQTVFWPSQEVGEIISENFQDKFYKKALLADDATWHIDDHKIDKSINCNQLNQQASYRLELTYTQVKNDAQSQLESSALIISIRQDSRNGSAPKLLKVFFRECVMDRKPSAEGRFSFKLTPDQAKDLSTATVETIGERFR